MARVILKGGPTPGPLSLPMPLPPPYFDARTEHGVFRYVRTEEIEGDRIVYVTGEMVLHFGELPPEEA